MYRFSKPFLKEHIWKAASVFTNFADTQHATFLIQNAFTDNFQG